MSYRPRREVNSVSSAVGSPLRSLQVRRGSEPALKKTTQETAANEGPISVQAVVASINALSTAGGGGGSSSGGSSNGSSHSARENFLRQRSKTSVNPTDFWGSSGGGSNFNSDAASRRSFKEGATYRSSLRNAMPVVNRPEIPAPPSLATMTPPPSNNTVQIIHTSPDSEAEASDPSAAPPLNVLRRREPLGASANKPESMKEVKKPATVELVPILKNSKSYNALTMPAVVKSAPATPSNSEPSFEIVIQNEIGPLGIHVVPCDEDGRLIVQGIEPGGESCSN